MSTTLQFVIAALLVLGALGYAIWRLGPASLRRRLGRPDAPGKDSCSNCQAPEHRKPGQ